MERTVERLPPEVEKSLQFREFRTEIVFLPDVGLKQPGMIGAPVIDVRGGQSVTGKLAPEVLAGHLVLQFVETQILWHATVPLQA
jgi:hypothetical protein